jgi:hypothetical protein
MDIYSMSRNFWDYSFENPDRLKPNHAAVYFFAIEHCNRLGWKEKFGLPTTMVMEAVGIKNYKTYHNTLMDLVEIGLIKLIEKSKNQYSANVIALVNFTKAPTKALDKALLNHMAKQGRKQVQSIDSIDIPINKSTNIPIYKSTIKQADEFEIFWEGYGKKIDRSKCEKIWNKLTNEEITKLTMTFTKYIEANPDIQFRKNPSTYLNGKCFNDEIIIYPKQQQNNGNSTGEKLGTSAARMEALRNW